MPVALLAGGVVLDSAGHIEEHQGSALVVPERGLTVVPSGEEKSWLTLAHSEWEASSYQSWMYQPQTTAFPIVDNKHELWLRISHPSDNWVLCSLHVTPTHVEALTAGVRL